MLWPSRRPLLAPTEVESVVLYRPVQSSAEIAPLQGNASRPVLSVKEAFFPPTERLLLIGKTTGPGDGTGGQFRLRETLPEGEQIVFGVRPCDARGMRGPGCPLPAHPAGRPVLRPAPGEYDADRPGLR